MLLMARPPSPHLLETTPPWPGGLPLELAAQLGRKVEIHASHGHWSQAVRCILAAKRDHEQAKKDRRSRTTASIPMLPLSQVGLSQRIVNGLEEKGYMTVSDLVKASSETILAIPNFGTMALNKIEKALDGLGLQLKEVNRDYYSEKQR